VKIGKSKSYGEATMAALKAVSQWLAAASAMAKI